MRNTRGSALGMLKSRRGTATKDIRGSISSNIHSGNNNMI